MEENKEKTVATATDTSPQETELAEHHDRAHALLSASSSHRWLACTPSARLADEVHRVPQSSAFAEEGTLAHEIAETCLRAYLEGSEMPTFDSIDELDKKVIRNQLSLYLDSVIGVYETLKRADPETKMYPEVQVSYENVAQGGFGTSDCVIVGNKELHVIDLKFGKGIKVDAPKNPQLRLYGIGCLNKFDNPDPLFGSSFDSVITTIIQPRLDHVSNEELTPAQLMKWGEEVVKPQAEKAWKGEGVLVTGEHCRFCPAKAACPLILEKNMIFASSMEEYPDAKLVPTDQFAKLVPLAKGIKSWCEDLIEYATDQAKLGDKISGLKLVEGRGKDVWDGEDAAVKKLKELGFDEEALFTKKMISPSQLLKAVDDETMEQEIRKLVVRVPGNPVLVDESDRREPIPDEVLKDLYGNNAE